MPPTNRLDAFRSIPLFAGLSDAALERIVAVATPFEVSAGHVLIEPGREGSGMFVLEEGTVLVGQGSKKIRVGAGEMVGELALLTPDAVRAARVQAETDVRGVAIARADFLKLLDDEPSIAVTMLQVLANRLARTMRG